MKDEKLAVSSYLSSVRVSKATLEEWERDCEAIFGTRDLLGLMRQLLSERINIENSSVSGRGPDITPSS